MSEKGIIVKSIQEWGGSYEEIHEVLYRAHQKNRENGIVYKSSLLDGEGLRNKVGEGITYVALLGDHLVGTASVSLRKGKYWYDKGRLVAHYCLAGVLPEYQGKGIMKQIDVTRESFAISNGAKLIRSGTAEKNYLQRNRFLRNGFIPVDFLVTKGNGYYSVMYAKWLDASIAQKPWKCKLHKIKSELKVRLTLTSNGARTVLGRALSSNVLISLRTRFRKNVFYRFITEAKRILKHEDDNSRFESLSLSGRRKMRWAYVLYGLPYKDFYRCRCDLLPLVESRNIVPFVRQKAFYKRTNSKRAYDLLCDKFMSYDFFKSFYNRDVVLVKDGKGHEKYEDFCAKHTRFILKPLRSNCGKGIQIVDQKELVLSLSVLESSYPRGFIVEELISQSSLLAQFHSSSVNTLRINTVNYGKTIEVKWPCLRMGRGDKVVDNAGSGGVFGAIDVVSGKIIAASDEFHHVYTVHPDTGIPIVGFEIPLWKEACELAKQLASLIPDCPFVGWDFALTDNGWIMVEGNYGPLLIWQIAVGKGIREEFEKMLDKLDG